MKTKINNDRIRGFASQQTGKLVAAAASCSTALVGLLMLAASPASAQVQAKSHELYVYAGALFGDELTESSISNMEPELDDDVTFGLRYDYNITDAWGVELSTGYTPTSVTEMAGGDVDFDLITTDINVLWHYNTGTRWVPFLVAGVGYAWGDLDHPMQGTVDGKDVRIEDDGGVVANAGIGLKCYVTEHFVMRVDARYRYIDALLADYDDSLNTFETTLGIGWRF